VSEAIATLPWVEATSIYADRRKRQVKFTLKDRAQSDFAKLKATVSDAGYPGTKLLTGPTDS
jgi:hypothetical protein